MKILLAGGTGFLGTQLAYALLRKGHEVIVLSRQNPENLKPAPYRIISWPLQSTDHDLFMSCECVVNLAGESIAGKSWSIEQKKKILNSRVDFTTELLDYFRSSTKLRLLLNSSAIGFYGDRKTEVLNESSPRGEGFLSDVCVKWEAAALSLQNLKLRTVLLRTGVVLSREHGFLKEVEPLYRNSVGGPVGSGEQMISWIHIDDWVKAVIYCIENETLHGPVNLVAPEPVSNKSFNSLMSNIFGQLFSLPAPAIALKLFLGEMSTLALNSQNVRPEKLLAAGFQFKYAHLKDALWQLYNYEKYKGQVPFLHTTTTWVPAPIESVFAFFSDEKNLEKMTPEKLNFHVLKKSTEKIIKGTLIDYKLKIHGLPIKWRTLIDDWRPPLRFADQQLIGPYSLWYHVHSFESLGGGTLMVDTVDYKIPLGMVGRLVAGPFVRNDVEDIFKYRQKQLPKYFF